MSDIAAHTGSLMNRLRWRIIMRLVKFCAWFAKVSL